MAGERVHRNLIDSSRQLFELDPGAAIESEDGWLFGAGSPSHPVISNAAFRSDDSVNAEEFVSRAKDFFHARGRGFSTWIRGEEPEDLDVRPSNVVQLGKASPRRLVAERAVRSAPVIEVQPAG